MAAIILLAVWAIQAPAGWVIGHIARNHYEDEAGSDLLPWLCMGFPPLTAVIAIALILKEEAQ